MEINIKQTEILSWRYLSTGTIDIYIYIFTYISNGLRLSTLPQRVLNTHMRGWLLWLLKKVQTQVICTTMVSWMIPIVRQSKTDLIHRQVMRPFRHGCELSQFLTAWRFVLSMKPWSYIWLEFGLFSTIIYIYGIMKKRFSSLIELTNKLI